MTSGGHAPAAATRNGANRRERLDCVEANPMAGVFPPPSGECVPPALWCGGRTHSLGGEGVGGSVFWKTPGTALYPTYVSIVEQT